MKSSKETLEDARQLDSAAIKCLESGRYDEGLKMLREAVAMAERTAGPEGVETMEFLNDLATSLNTLGYLAEAEQLWRRLYAWYEARYGMFDERTRGVLQLVAEVYYAQGKLQGKEPQTKIGRVFGVDDIQLVEALVVGVAPDSAEALKKAVKL